MLHAGGTVTILWQATGLLLPGGAKDERELHGYGWPLRHKVSLAHWIDMGERDRKRKQEGKKKDFSRRIQPQVGLIRTPPHLPICKQGCGPKPPPGSRDCY